MDMTELVELATRLNAAYEARDTLVKNTELLAEPARKYIRGAIIDFFNTKKMLLAVANTVKIRATHSIYRSVFGAVYNTVMIGNVGGIQLRFYHNGILANKRQSGSETIYGACGEGTRYIDCDLTWSCGQSPSIEFDLTYCDWMRNSKTLEEALEYFDTHRWTADGYVKLRDKARLAYQRIELMKECFKNYADGIVNDVKTDTANLVAGL